MKRILFSLYLSSLVLFANGQHITLTPHTYSSKQSSTVSNFSLKGINAIDFIATRHSGTLEVPTATNTGSILEIGAAGYDGTEFTDVKSRIQMVPSENWAPTANGIGIRFATTANGSTALQTRMIIAHDGNVGIGTFLPKVKHHIFDNSSGVTPHSYTKLFVEDNASTFIGIGVPDGSESGIVFGNPTGGSARGGVIMEGDGTLKLRAGSATRMTISNDGIFNFGNFVSAGSTFFHVTEGNLVVNNDMAVGGNIYLSGCVMGPLGIPLLGICVSDARYKTNIKPFSSVLNQFVKLQPVDFNWKADEFPQKGFGNEQSYGLIAQEVEKIFPDMVVKDKDGYLKVNYGKLPLLSIQAIKELKIENDELKALFVELKGEIQHLKYILEKH